MTMLAKELISQREEIESYLETVSSIGIVLIDAALNILDCNQGFTRMFQLKQQPVGAPVAYFLILGDNELKHAAELQLYCNQQSGLNGTLYCRVVKTESGYLLFCERLIMTESRAIEQIGAINNELINLQRDAVKKNLLLEKLSRDLDVRIAELEATLDRVKQLEGIIPICSYCKKIRDDQHGWQGLEKYISAHSEAQFSHGICPACFEEEMKKVV
jgi:PAS domain-containing protein